MEVCPYCRVVFADLRAHFQDVFRAPNPNSPLMYQMTRGPQAGAWVLITRECV